MQARAPLALILLLGGCCMGGTSTPSASPPPEGTSAGPSGPSAPGCPDVTTAILGTWQRAGFVEEYRPGGVYVLNGTEGTIAWMRTGHALLDVPSLGYHAECDFALSDATTLVTAEPNRVGNVYSRTSAAPSIPANCFDLTSAWSGTWTPTAGGPAETYTADGRYAAPGTGTWSFLAPGRLHLVGDNGLTSDYVLGMSSATTALAVSMPPLAQTGVVYTRSP